MELGVYLLVLWASMIPFRLFCTWLGLSRRVLFMVFLVVVGVTRHFEVPERWMEAVERPERDKNAGAGAVKDGRGGAPKRVLDRSTGSKGRGRTSPAVLQLEEERKRAAAAAARARERYEAEQRRRGQSFGDADRTDGSTHGQ